MEIINTILYAFVIFSESLHEPVIDKIAVASVIHNRAAKSSYYEVLTSPKQFSCLNDCATIINNVAKIHKRHKDFELCLKIAYKFTSGQTDPITPATHYTRKEIRRVWMRDMTVVFETKNHKFMTEEKQNADK